MCNCLSLAPASEFRTFLSPHGLVRYWKTHQSRCIPLWTTAYKIGKAYHMQAHGGHLTVGNQSFYCLFSILERAVYRHAKTSNSASNLDY